jgi:hypothetical protein
MTYFGKNVSHQEATQFLKSKSYYGNGHFSCLFCQLSFTENFHSNDLLIHANLPQGRQNYITASSKWNPIFNSSHDNISSTAFWYPKIGTVIP